MSGYLFSNEYPMQFQLGTDEAGYGPNLGPLVISGTDWEMASASECLYSRLLSGVTPDSAGRNAKRMWVADSKKVYGSSRRIENLELPVLAAVASVFQVIPANLRELLGLISDTDCVPAMGNQFWIANQNLSLPVKVDRDAVEQLSHFFQSHCESASVHLKSIACDVVMPDQFNCELETHDNKATLLSNRTLRLARESLMQHRLGGIVSCDKHGGRSRYVELIQNVIGPEDIAVIQESRELSEYQVQHHQRQITMRFQARGESFLPTALASMISKYVRELVMILWNRFWQEHLPGLKATKGYPQDAKRFKREIAAAQQKLGIADHSIWRRK